MSMIDRSTTAPRDFDDLRLQGALSRRIAKRRASRQSRHQGARRSLAWGIEEARDLHADQSVGTFWVLFLALWIREKAEAFYQQESYYDSFGEATLADSWEYYVPWALDQIEYA